jgi:hypothetical protein
LLKIRSPSPILLKIRKELKHDLVKDKEPDPDHVKDKKGA